MSAIREENIGFGGNDSQYPSSTASSVPSFQDVVETAKTIPNFDKSLKASKELLENFSDRMKRYPFNISLRGCEILCIAVISDRAVSIKELPSGDVDILKSKFPSNVNPNKIDNLINVTLEDNDFKLTFRVDGGPFDMYVFNSTRGIGFIPQQNTPDNFTKEYKPETLVDIRSTKPNNNGNKNAFEIRRDILDLAIQWMMVEDSTAKYKKPSDDELLRLAKRFYDFVENKNK